MSRKIDPALSVVEKIAGTVLLLVPVIRSLWDLWNKEN